MRRLALALFVLAACASDPPPRAAPPPVYQAPVYGYAAPQPSPPPAAAYPCAGAEGYACSPDRGALLRCAGGQATTVGTCRGPRGCVVGQAVDCDHSVAAPNDPCDEPGQGIACSTDRKTLLRCDARRVYVASESCRNACLSAGGKVLCQ